MLAYTEGQKDICKTLVKLAFKSFVRNTMQVDIFTDVVINTLGDGIWISEEYIFIISNSKESIEDIYKHSTLLVNHNSNHLSRVFIRKIIYAFEYLAESLQVVEEEREIIDRFENHLFEVYETAKQEPELEISKEKANLYSAIGQLAYVIAMADHVLEEEERFAFKQVIKKHLGVFTWLAKDRFKVIDDLKIFDLENAYDHTLYLIRKNKSALDEQMVDTFMIVMEEVAKVAGISAEEQEVINRFRKDLASIYTK